LFAWGSNGSGQLGDGYGYGYDRSSPVQIGSSSWTAVTAGIAHSAAIRTDGKLFTWGNNYYGALGDGTTTYRSSPVQLGTSSWGSISSRGLHVLGIK